MNYIEQKKKKTNKKQQQGIKELRRIKTKFLHAGYPKFINDTFLRFNKEKEELLILKWLLDETRLVVIELLSAPRNEKFSKQMTNFYF